MTLARGTTQAARFRSRIKANTDPTGMFSLAAILRPDKPRQRPRARAWGGATVALGDARVLSFGWPSRAPRVTGMRQPRGRENLRA